MPKARREPGTRPYWHVDLKWVCGILLVICLSISLGLHVVSKLTSRDVGVPLATLVVASLFSPDGLDSDEGLEEIKAEYAGLAPTEVIHPIEGQPVTITKHDLDTLTPRDLRLKIFGQVVERVYDDGVEALAEETAEETARSPDQQAEIRSEAGLFNLFSADVHQRLQGFFWLSLVPTLALLAGVVYFSHRWGRLVSVGVALLFVTFVPAVILLVGRIASGHAGEGAEGPAALFNNEAAAGAVRALEPAVLPVFALGLLLPLVAAVGRRWERRARRGPGRVRRYARRPWSTKRGAEPSASEHSPLAA